MKKFSIVLLFVGLACGKEDPVHSSTRPFLMGFTPFPYDVSAEALNSTYSQLNKYSDIINHHFDDGVPWVEALANAPFHENIRNDWAFRKSQTPAAHKIYVSVAPINVFRNGLAPYRSEEPNEDLPDEWEDYRFNSVQVKQAFLNYCKRIIDYFNPDYFNMSIEANLLHFNRPELWSDYMDLHKFIYTELKKSYPTLTIFTSQVALYFLDGFIGNVNVDYERKAASELLDYSDLFGISIYPYLTNYLGSDIPTNTFDKLFTLSRKPVAIAETGFAAQEFSIAINQDGSFVQVMGSKEKQNKYFKDLLLACEKYKAQFVINYEVRDYDQLWIKLGSPTNFLLAWRDCGFIDENGIERPVLTTWQEWLNKSYKR